MRNRILFSFLAWVAVIVSVQGKQKDFVLQSGRPVAIACSGSEAPVVRTSLDLLSRDLQTVLSATAHIDTNTGNIIVGTIGQSKLIEQAGIDISALKNKKQAFMLAVSEDGKLVVAGSDSHGTAYGILEISRLLGVSPWEWWADVTPEKKETFRLSGKFRELQSPSVEYRGIFINDEDWGLMPLRAPIFSMTVPIYSSGTSIKRRSIGSHFLPSISLNNTLGVLTASSKPSRRIVSIRIDKCISPRPLTIKLSVVSVSDTRNETSLRSSLNNRSRS